MIHPCPNRPNCVSTVGPPGSSGMEPIPFQGALGEARKRLLQIISGFPRATVTQNIETYLKAEFRSRIFSFVDDVEFEFDDRAKLIHFKSASRLGYYDFGVNRKRMEEIIERFVREG